MDIKMKLVQECLVCWWVHGSFNSVCWMEELFMLFLKITLYVGLPCVLLCFYLGRKGYLRKLLRAFQLNRHVGGAPSQKKDFMGLQGIVISPLMPSGKIRVQGKTLEATLLDGFAEVGESVTIIDYRDFSYICSKIENH